MALPLAIHNRVFGRFVSGILIPGLMAMVVAVADDSPDWDPLADPDQDGRPNILELAVGSDEQSSDSDPYVVLDLDQLSGTGEIRFSF